jgi:hypothetical protein
VVVSVLAVFATTWLGLADFRRKAKADVIEADLQLLRSFAELAPIADAREGAFLSEVVAARLVEGWPGPPVHLDLRPAVAQGSVSAARQAAVVTAIAELTATHEALAGPGKAMLRGLKHLNENDDEEVKAAYQAAVDRVGGMTDSPAAKGGAVPVESEGL